MSCLAPFRGERGSGYGGSICTAPSPLSPCIYKKTKSGVDQMHNGIAEYRSGLHSNSCTNFKHRVQWVSLNSFILPPSTDLKDYIGSLLKCKLTNIHPQQCFFFYNQCYISPYIGPFSLALPVQKNTKVISVS